MSKTIHYPKRPELKLKRDLWGVIHVQATELSDIYRGLGYAHGLDRGMQLLLMRILGRGQGSQHLAADQSMLEIDQFFRRMNWSNEVEAELAKLTPQARLLCSAYCEGLNTRLQESIPWELKVLGYHPDPWTLADCILLSRMTGYVSLSQSQAEIEDLLFQMIQEGLDTDKLRALFGPLTELDDDLIALLRQVNHQGLVPEAVRWNAMLPKLIASNNWVVSGSQTRSGQAILANDPHLEGNRLPNVWYEVALETPERYAIGASMPGLPGILVGRSNDLAWGATYTFMDAVDSWVEEIKDGHYRRDLNGQTQWLALIQRTETIQRKGQPEQILEIYSTPHGVLSQIPDQDGYYLATRWASALSGGETLNHSVAMWSADSVQTGMQHLGQFETSWNWVLADQQGNIGYQMSGKMPIRREGLSGLVPVPGWLAENDWQGFVAPEALPRCYNPESGYFVTANHDLNAWGQAQPINMPMGDYRAKRISEQLEAAIVDGGVDVRACRAIQLDLYSKQAELYLQILRPLLPDTSSAQLLKNWDGCYQPDSQAAWLFEVFYRELIMTVFGPHFGPEVCQQLLTKTGILADFYANFDRVLLAQDSPWFNGQSREALYSQALERALLPSNKPQRWGHQNRFVLRHLIFGGKLPVQAGFDYGPIEVPGGRATPQQGQIYHSGERQTSFVPSLRLIVDFVSQGLHSCLLGGPSDRRFSRWYTSEVKNWLEGQYKYTEPGSLKSWT